MSVKDNRIVLFGYMLEELRNRFPDAYEFLTSGEKYTIEYCKHCHGEFKKPFAIKTKKFCSDRCRDAYRHEHAPKTGRKYITTPKEADFWNKVIKQPDGCWEWAKGRRRNPGISFENSYGVVYRNRKPYYAHRIAWEITFGSIPKGLEVCHKWDNAPCCNPDHLFLGTHLDNMRDMIKKGRHAKIRKVDE